MNLNSNPPAMSDNIEQVKEVPAVGRAFGRTNGVSEPLSCLLSDRAQPCILLVQRTAVRGKLLMSDWSERGEGLSARITGFGR
jgi:hypothetical protein